MYFIITLFILGIFQINNSSTKENQINRITIQSIDLSESKNCQKINDSTDKAFIYSISFTSDFYIDYKINGEKIEMPALKEAGIFYKIVCHKFTEHINNVDCEVSILSKINKSYKSKIIIHQYTETIDGITYKIEKDFISDKEWGISPYEPFVLRETPKSYIVLAYSDFKEDKIKLTFSTFNHYDEVQNTIPAIKLYEKNRQLFCKNVDYYGMINIECEFPKSEYPVDTSDVFKRKEYGPFYMENICGIVDYKFNIIVHQSGIFVYEIKPRLDFLNHEYCYSNGKYDIIISNDGNIQSYEALDQSKIKLIPIRNSNNTNKATNADNTDDVGNVANFAYSQKCDVYNMLFYKCEYKHFGTEMINEFYIEMNEHISEEDLDYKYVFKKFKSKKYKSYNNLYVDNKNWKISPEKIYISYLNDLNNIIKFNIEFKTDLLSQKQVESFNILLKCKDNIRPKCNLDSENMKKINCQFNKSECVIKEEEYINNTKEIVVDIQHYYCLNRYEPPISSKNSIYIVKGAKTYKFSEDNSRKKDIKNSMIGGCLILIGCVGIVIAISKNRKKDRINIENGNKYQKYYNNEENNIEGKELEEIYFI